MLPREQMTEDARRLRDFYARKPGAPVVMREFGFYSLEKWQAEGHFTDFSEIERELGLGEQGGYALRNMGWCEAQFYPAFEEKVLEDQGDHELVQDFAGRKVLCFKGRRSGFMPEYVDHPVKDMRSWEENCLWRMDIKTPERTAETNRFAAGAVAAAKQGRMIQLCVGGAFMYLRSLIGPADLLYTFYDQPELIHACMRSWFELNDKTIEQYQKVVSADEIFFGEDICYNHGLLVSPDMVREFLMPYYQQMIANIKRRNLDPNRHLYVQIDTDGDCRPAIPLYREMGMDCMSPFEVASGCDVVQIGKDEPELVMFGGIDKRILASGREAIAREIERILPVMKARGGYLPTCDHGVPEEVPFDDWVYFRRLLLDYAK